MIKLQLSLITIMFLCVMTTISSTSKDYPYVLSSINNTQTAEVILHPNPNQTECEQHFQDQQDASKKVKNKTSKYTGVYWYKDCKKWGVELKHNKKRHYGGLFDNEEHAAMKVNLLCDKYEIKRKNPTIDTDPDTMQKLVQNKTSKYAGVYWNANARKWHAQLRHDAKYYYGGLFDNEKHAAMKVNLLCDKYEKPRKHPMINIDLDAIQKVQNKTSKYAGVSWHKTNKCWQVQFQHNTETHYGGLFDNEEHAAMKVNLLCDKYEIERKHPTINIDLYRVQRVQNKTSKYIGVCWNLRYKKWQAQLGHNKKQYYGGYFDIEDHAAMKVNLLCDKYGIKRKHPMIIIEPDTMWRVKNQTSKYIGVSWNKRDKKWKAILVHKGKDYFGGYFEIEEDAAMKVNLLCDEYETERKNQDINKDAIQKKTKSKIYQSSTENIVNNEVKVEDENILDRFKDECQDRFMQCNDEERCIATEFQNSNAKRKRKQDLILNNDVKEEKEEITTPNHDESELLETIKKHYTRLQD